MSYPKQQFPRRMAQPSIRQAQVAPRIQTPADQFGSYAPPFAQGPQEVFEPSAEFGNIYQEAAKYRWDPQQLQLYERTAFQAGLNFGASAILYNLIMGDITDIHTDTAAHPDIPVSFNANIRNQVLRYQIDKPSFIRRVTGVVNALMVHPEAVSGFEGAPIPNTEPQALYEIPYDGQRALDWVWGQWRIEGSNQLLNDTFMPLSVLLGTGIDTYFYDLIPAIGHGTNLRLELTIDPPQNQIPQTESLFVARIGYVAVQLHLEQFKLYG